MRVRGSGTEGVIWDDHTAVGVVMHLVYWC